MGIQQRSRLHVHVQVVRIHYRTTTGGCSSYAHNPQNEETVEKSLAKWTTVASQNRRRNFFLVVDYFPRIGVSSELFVDKQSQLCGQFRKFPRFSPTNCMLSIHNLANDREWRIESWNKVVACPAKSWSKCTAAATPGIECAETSPCFSFKMNSNQAHSRIKAQRQWNGKYRSNRSSMT